ncbi:MAG: NHL domain-containing protein [Sporichthyaceae bacterium]
MASPLERVLAHPHWRWLVHLAVPVVALAVLFGAVVVGEALDTEQRISTARCTPVPTPVNAGFGSGIAIGSGEEVYVLQAQARCVVRLDAQGNGAIVAGAPGGADCAACDVDLGRPFDLAVGADGTLYVGQQEDADVLVVRPDGSTRTIEANYDDFVRPAVQALALIGTDVLYVAEQNRIRRYDDRAEDPEDRKRVVAGGGDRDVRRISVEDSIPASDLALGEVRAMAVAGDGTVYLVQEDRYRVLKVSPEGLVSWFAGTGEPGDDGDGGPAKEARIDATGIAADTAGNVWVSIQDGHRIRRIDSSGRISTVAGVGRPGPGGDGGPAEKALLNYPSDLVYRAGSLFVLDGGQVRRIDAAGTIDTLGPRRPD